MVIFDYLYPVKLNKEQAFIKKIGDNIDALRKQQGFTITALAKVVKMDKSNLNRILKGRTNPTAKNLYNIAKALKTEPYELLK